MCFNLLILVALFLVNFAPASCEVDAFIYNGFQSRNLSLDGIAEVTSNGLLLLTNSTVQDQGHAFYPNPIHFKNKPDGNAFSFSTTFVFAIRSDNRPLDGHGLIFIIVPQRGIRGAVANHYLGLFNSTNNGNRSNRVVGIELDTIFSDEFGDVDNNHVGIDINGLKSVAAKTAGYFDGTGLFHNLTLISGQPMQVWVDYEGSNKQINVTLAPLHVGKPVRPLLTLKYDLSPILDQIMYVGFSSSTGSVPTHHYILGWSFKTNGKAQELYQLPNLPRLARKGASRFVMIGLPLISLVSLVVATSILVYYVKRKKYQELLEDWEREYRPQRFKYKDLYKATKGFREKELLGAGGFGKVYKGVMPITKLEIAVKKISHESRQGMKEFVSEIVSIGRIQHRNVVPLLGYCRRKGELLLVYEYMSNGSLDKFYTTNQDSPSFRPTMRQILLFLDGVVALPELSELGVSSAGLTFDHRGGFDDFVKSYPSSSVNAHSCSPSVTDSSLIADDS